MFFVPILFDLLFPSDYIKETYYWTASVLVTAKTIIEIKRRRLEEICFDESNRQIFLVHRNLISSQRRIVITFESARLEIARTRSCWSWLWGPMTLYFLQNKMEVLEVTKFNDGFSVEKLNEICNTAKRLSLPMANVT